MARELEWTRSRNGLGAAAELDYVGLMGARQRDRRRGWGRHLCPGILRLLFLFGPIFGAAQALVLARYLTRETAALWVLVSFLGWFAGVVAVATAVGLLGEGVQDEVAQWTGSEVPLILTLMVLAWTVLGASQALVLLKRLSASSHALAALWALAAAVGGAAAQAAIFYLAIALPGLASADAGDGFLRQVLSGAVGVGAGVAAGPGGVVAGTLYGAATSVVLAMIARRSAVQEDSTR